MFSFLKASIILNTNEVSNSTLRVGIYRLKKKAGAISDVIWEDPAYRGIKRIGSDQT